MGDVMMSWDTQHVTQPACASSLMSSTCHHTLDDVAYWQNVAGHNPYTPLLDGAKSVDSNPEYDETAASLLPQLQKPLRLTFIDKLSSPQADNRAAWKVSWHGSDASYNTAILKIYSNRQDGYTGYLREAGAYRSAVPSIMPSFYGAYTFSPSEIIEYHLVADSSFYVDATRPISALLLEYVEGEKPSPWNITLELAKKAVGALEQLHHAGIIHDDLCLRNMIISSDKERFVLIDFDSADVFENDDPEYRMRLYDSYPFVNERAEMWSMFYLNLLPDRTRVERGARPYLSNMFS
ncbi:hypothetical protein C8J56DRAFT_1162143 [Mycena floridula]|nr:hypothetical protein C8J56DRAFT_1162143 [Mycena floridula]